MNYFLFPPMLLWAVFFKLSQLKLQHFSWIKWKAEQFKANTHMDMHQAHTHLMRFRLIIFWFFLLPGCFSSMCRFVQDVTEVRIFFLKAGEQSLHRNETFFPCSLTSSEKSFQWSYIISAALSSLVLSWTTSCFLFWWRCWRLLPDWLIFRYILKLVYGVF